MLTTLTRLQELGREILQSTDGKYFEAKLKKLEPQQLLELLETCGTSSGGGGSERKVPKLITVMFEELSTLASGANFVDLICEHFIQAAMSRFIDEFHVSNDDSVTVDMSGFKALVKKTFNTGRDVDM